MYTSLSLSIYIYIYTHTHIIHMAHFQLRSILIGLASHWAQF